MYKRNANQLSTDLLQAFPDAKVLINDTKPRSKSYELMAIKEEGEGWFFRAEVQPMESKTSLYEPGDGTDSVNSTT